MNEINRKVRVGRLDKIYFPKGCYFYIGSAKRNLEARIRRHLKKIKTIFWHIDYLLSKRFIGIKEVWISFEPECKIAQGFYKRGYNFINKFGSSDCKCKSHLFFIKGNFNKIKNLLKKNRFINASKNYF